METPTPKWQYLEHKPGSVYGQLFVKGTNVAARTLFDHYRSLRNPLALDDIAENFSVSPEAVREAISYVQTDPPAIERDRKLDDERVQQRLRDLPTRCWQYLDRKPGSNYRQLFVRPQNIRAFTLSEIYRNDDAPQTIEEIADAYCLPVDAVVEALAYCASDPPEIRKDREREEALREARGMNEPNYKYNARPRLLSPQEEAEIVRRYS